MKKVTFIGSESTDDYGDSAHVFYKVIAERGQEALDIIDQEIGSGGCSHTHDCCGCVFYHPAEIIHHDRVYGYFILKQSAHRNI